MMQDPENMEDEEEHPIRNPTASYGWASQNLAIAWWKVHTRMRWQPSVCPVGGCTSWRWLVSFGWDS